jgi:hypothetical protein
MQGMLTLWAMAAVLLLAGWRPRLFAGIAWLFSMSCIGLNPYLHNSGDHVRNIILFYLMLSPCEAAWSLTDWRLLRQRSSAAPRWIAAWSVRLLFIQLASIYFFNGVYKLAGPSWREGVMLQQVLANLAWTRLSFAQLPLPEQLVRYLTWIVLFWELGFPCLMMHPRLRTPTLLLGVGFHVGTGALLQLGPFPLYMLCLYLPLIPWERWTDR